ncbi:ATP-dependent DNA helicase II subunit 1 [Escovopsis weberi]|uniref:ATP-dependent DNA helicase II subunit 1 n=1 Tax=Escovopsis weberi TaxID=150374 RepID=A0A0M9VVY1_ESCWE|nr:ATP-dependent DNA helicase II subunit 1 [Escovopsis weberi]
MANPSDDWNREVEEDEQEVDETNFKAQKDAILMAIEVSESMLREPPFSDEKKADLDSPLRAALKCAYHLMQQRIISNPRDMMGILLYGTEKAKFGDWADGRGGSGYPNCYLLTDLDIPAAEDVKALRELAEEGEDEEGILTAATTESLSMANMLFCANQIFTTKAANFRSRRLFLVTDNDDPHGSDKAARSAAAVRAKDLYDLGITIDLFPITTGKSSFDVGKFYDDIVYRDPNSGGNGIELRTSKSGHGLTLLKSLTSNINFKQIPKRSMFNIPFEIAPGLRISVKGYNVVHRQTPERSCYVWLDGEKAQIAVSETTRIADDSARTVEKHEVKKAYKFGGEYVYFTPEEHEQLGDFGPPIIRIIGFKPRDTLSKFAGVRKSTFIHPNEDDYIGSSRVFSALWKKLLDSRKIGIAWCLLRSNANPTLAAIIPSGGKAPEEAESDEAYALPAGLWVYPLPMADDIRDVKHNLGDQKQCSDQLKSHMGDIVKQLKLPKGRYDPKKYPNPSLQWHYKILQAIALEDEHPEEAEDLTQPRVKAIGKRAGGFIEDWADRLKEDGAEASRSRKLKRESDEETSERPVKHRRQAASEMVSSMSKSQLSLAVRSGGINAMTVSQLKEVLKAQGQSTLGRKPELIERIEQLVERKR